MPKKNIQKKPRYFNVDPSKSWPPCKVGDVVVIKWRDPSMNIEMSVAAIAHHGYEIVHTTTLGQVVAIEKDSMALAMERVWNDLSENCAITVMPRECMQQIIIMMREEDYLIMLDPLVAMTESNIGV